MTTGNVARLVTGEAFSFLHIESQCHNSRSSLEDGVYDSFRSRYFPALCQNVLLTHGPLSFGMISAALTLQTHTHTEALSVTASLFTHWETLSTFIALSQWGTLSERSPSPSTLTLHSITSGLDCSMSLGRSLSVCLTSNAVARHQGALIELINTTEAMQPTRTRVPHLHTFDFRKKWGFT